MIDFNDALPWPFLEGATDALIDLKFEELMGVWHTGLSQLYEYDERYDPLDFKPAFLEFCAREFDRYYTHGPAQPWPRHK
jgi:hypothetical protein